MKKNAKNKKTSTNTKKDENENMLLEYMEDVDDKFFKKYSNSKNFNSFINELDRPTNEKDKEKVVKELKDTNYTQLIGENTQKLLITLCN